MGEAHNKGSIGPKLREAIRYLLHVSDDLEQAAKHAGMTTYRLREALKRPHVRAFHQAEKRALLDVYCSGNPGALRSIRDQSANMMARVQAIRTMEQLGDEEEVRRRHGEPITPGLVVMINAPMGERVTIAAPPPAKPLPAPEPELLPTPPLSRAVNEPAFRGRRTPPAAWPIDRNSD